MPLKNLLFIISLVVLVVGTSSLLCIPFAIWYNEPLQPFYIPALVLLVSGFLLFSVSGKKFAIAGSNRERVVIIMSSWFVLILTGMMPYLISRTVPSPVDAFFETVSGMTATGSSILTNIEDFPESILFWRSLTHWIGGLVTLTVLFTIMPSLNVGGNELFLIKEKAVQRIRIVVIRVFFIYCTLTVAQVLLLLAGGMNFYESLCHSFGTVSSGCFSPKNNSIAGYSSYLQYVMAFFMFLSGFSYVIFYLIITGKFKRAVKAEENRVYFIVAVSALVLITGMLYFKAGTGFDVAFREGFFQTASFVSSSGYYTINYLMWPDHILPLLYLLLFIGGCSASVSGGIKMSRFLILLKNFRLQFKNPGSSSNISVIKYNRSNIGENANLSVLTFITVFGMLFVAGTVLLSSFCSNLSQSVFLALSALSNFGHNMVLSDFPDAGKISMAFLMIIGRLEIYPLLLFFLPAFYKKADANQENISE